MSALLLRPPEASRALPTVLRLSWGQGVEPTAVASAVPKAAVGVPRVPGGAEGVPEIRP
jgi:hypothetical protein